MTLELLLLENVLLKVITWKRSQVINCKRSSQMQTSCHSNTLRHIYTHVFLRLWAMSLRQRQQQQQKEITPKSCHNLLWSLEREKKKRKKEKKLYMQQYLYSEIHCKLWQLKSNNSSKLREDEQQFWNVL